MMTNLSLSDVGDVIAWFEGGDDENELKAASMLRAQSAEIERLKRLVNEQSDQLMRAGDRCTCGAGWAKPKQR